MQVVTQYPPNTFAWIDLATPDPAAAKAFYTALFGWDAIDTPLPGGGPYTMLQQDGKDVAALSGHQEGQEGQPAFWSSYISVEDVDAMTEKAAAAAASVVAPPFDVMEVGRMSVIQDPGGAFVSLWEPRTHIGAQLVNIPNTLSWNELATHDADRAATFYTELFGWVAQPVENDPSPTPYVTFMNNGRAAAGMMAMTDEWGDMPAHWAIYIAVEDPAAIAARAAELGGTVITPPFGAEGIGTIAVLQDPQGAFFNIVRLENPDPMP